jgi:beta-aspartyl-dipeptidase (metallo-type)
MLILIENGELYDPAPRGTSSILLANDRIEAVGRVDRRALDALGVEHEVIDAAVCAVVPGFIDPHQHLLGGSGEGSLALQTPEMFLREIVRAGITSVVGTLGVDTTMKTIADLLARAKALEEEGLSAWIWTGGYNIPRGDRSRERRRSRGFRRRQRRSREVARVLHRERQSGGPAHDLVRH